MSDLHAAQAAVEAAQERRESVMFDICFALAIGCEVKPDDRVVDDFRAADAAVNVARQVRDDLTADVSNRAADPSTRVWEQS